MNCHVGTGNVIIMEINDLRHVIRKNTYICNNRFMFSSGVASMIAFISSRDRTAGRLRSLFIAGTVSSSQTVFSTFLQELYCRPIVICEFQGLPSRRLAKKTFRIFKRKIKRFFQSTKEVTCIRAIQLNSSFRRLRFSASLRIDYKKYLYT